VGLASGIAALLRLLWPNPRLAIIRIQEAAALWESLSQNHPFADGNKRVAVTAMAAFLSVMAIGLRLTIAMHIDFSWNFMKADDVLQ